MFDGHSLQLAPRSARRRRTPTPETGASETAGGHIDRPQFADYATARGWTTLRDLPCQAILSGVVAGKTPLFLTRFSNCTKSMQPIAVRAGRGCGMLNFSKSEVPGE